MRLVLVVPRFPRLSETFIVSKFLGLVDAGWDAHVVCAATEPWDAFPRLAARPELRRRVHRTWPHEPAWQAAALWLPAQGEALARAPRTTARYWRAAARTGAGRAARQAHLDATLIALSPDILHFEFGALAVGRTHLKQRLGCRLSVSFRGYDLNYVGLDEPGYYDEVWREADAVHTLGRDLWARALRRGCPPDKLHALIPPAVDASAFRPDPERTPDAIGATRPLRVLSVGRLEWKKGYEYGLEAIRLLKARGVSLTYRILGGGSYLEPLAFARRQMGLEADVEFLGPRPQAEVQAQLRWADVLLHPAVSEGFGNAVMEAQAMALPVVCSDADGLADNVADGLTGFVVPRRSPAAMAEALGRLAADPALRRQMGAAGRERVLACFRPEDQIAAFDRFYRDVTRAGAPRMNSSDDSRTVSPRHLVAEAADGPCDEGSHAR